MTWNELIWNIQQIPENRREEPATFMMRFDGDPNDEAYTIDSMEEVSLSELECDCHTGNDETYTTFVIAQ